MMATPFFPEIERSPVEEIRKFQETKLQQQLLYMKEKSSFYSDHFLRNRIDISRIKSIDDLVNIPPTTKEDLQKQNDDFICVPKHSIIDNRDMSKNN